MCGSRSSAAIFATHVCAADDEYSTGTSPNWRTAIVIACRIAAVDPEPTYPHQPGGALKIPNIRSTIWRSSSSTLRVSAPARRGSPSWMAGMPSTGRIGPKSMSVASGKPSDDGSHSRGTSWASGAGNPAVSGIAGGRPARRLARTRATGAGLSGG